MFFWSKPNYRDFSAIALGCVIIGLFWTGTVPLQTMDGPWTKVRDSKEVSTPRGHDGLLQIRGLAPPIWNKKGIAPHAGQMILECDLKQGSEVYGPDKDGTLCLLTSATLEANKSFHGDSYGDARSRTLGSGAGMTIGIWDRGLPLLSHQELKNRLIPGDDADSTASEHATIMSGVLLGAGINPKAKGIIPLAKGVVHDWRQDRLEAAKLAAQGLLVSCHAYGMESAHVPDWYFGKYLQMTQDWDRIMASMPHYLMVTAAGNNGNSGHNASPIYGDAQGGWDVLLGAALNKNGLTVGAAETEWGQDFLKWAKVAPYSSIGPTDDGRIKPDLAIDGRVQLTAKGPTDKAYTSAMGTSVATAKVSGHLMQLQEYYHNSKGSYMWASTLKGLILHTCIDIGTPGPDYTMGWGIMDPVKAAEAIEREGYSTMILEHTLEEDEVYTLNMRANGREPLAVSLSWTDPEGAPKTFSRSNNASSPVLINDLDMRLYGESKVYAPWLLDKYHPAQAAVAGDNKVDPLEHISVDQTENGIYTLKISHKGGLEGGAQRFSLIVSGIQGNDCEPVAPSTFDLNLVNDLVQVAWEDRGNADRFEIQYKAEGDTEWQSQFSSTPAADIGGLTPDVHYTLRIRSRCGTSIASDFSPSKSFWLQRVVGQETLERYAPNSDAVFPKVILLQNPVQDALIFSKDVPPNTYYRIYRGTGQLVRQGQLRSSRLDFDGFAAGLYILSLEYKGVLQSLRFLKK